MLHKMIPLAAVAILAMPVAAAAGEALVVPNGDFEAVSGSNTLPDGWRASFGKDTQASIEVEQSVVHGGKRSVRMTDQSPTAPYIYGHFASPAIKVQPSTTYIVKCFAKGESVGTCYVGVDFPGGGNDRQTLPVGTYDWQPVAFRVTTLADCTSIYIHFSTDGVTGSLWIDDVALEISPVQLANVTERRYQKDFPGMFPRSMGDVSEHLLVADATRCEADSMLLVALQGIVNRKQPRLYLLNRTNPAGYDEVWLKYMQEKQYTGQPERIGDPMAAIERFRNEVTGLVVYDPQLPGSINAAWMLAGLKNALPASPETAAKLDLPVVEDLRGKWTRNVDAYRYIYEHYWDQMCHHVLAWECPKRWQENSSRDYQVQWKVFCFWVSSYGDAGKGNDPPAEREFLDELLAATPGNVPVMGWMNDGQQGITEYAGAHWLSEYGKWLPGTGFNSNVSVHNAIRPAESAFQRKCPVARPDTKLQKDKIYISINVIDSGDAQWYWQLYQRKIWADPVRGRVPIGYGMNMTVAEMLPLVAQWYLEHATPNDTLFGFLYMNAPIYATRFCPQDRQRIWREYVAYHEDSCRKLGLEGIELYNGGAGPTAKDEVLRRFTLGMSHLDYILADLGRHSDIHPSNANNVLDNTVVFHTLTQFKVWGPHATVESRSMAQENAWLVDEIEKNSPTQRPGFMAAQAASWFYFPAWFKDLQERLPPQYVLVSPSELARLYRQSQQQDQASQADQSKTAPPEAQR
jgi:hypothetical protein